VGRLAGTRTWRHTLAATGAAFLVMATGGCFFETDSPSARVSSRDFGDRWPLTVSSGLLRCESDREITFQWKGTTYALTGSAEHRAYDDIAAIWAGTPGTGRLPLTPLVDRGWELCDHGS
jgi:hypothetical protein